MIDLHHPDGATPLDPDEAEGLLLTHITTRGELDRWEQDNISEAIRWLEKRKPNDILTQEFVKTLHRRMFCNVWKWAGKFRQSDKIIGSPWWRIPEDLKNLCLDVGVWLEKKIFSPDETATRFHHRLILIHPFPNGNRRHGRLMKMPSLDHFHTSLCPRQPEGACGSVNGLPSKTRVQQMCETIQGQLPSADLFMSRSIPLYDVHSVDLPREP